MTRLTETMCNLRTAKYANINLRSKPMLRTRIPMELKDTVRGKNDQTADGCVRQLLEVLSCWNRYSFESKPCTEVIKNFQTCFAEMEMAEKNRKEMESKGLIADQETKLSRKQVNTLLKRNPQLRPHDPFKMHNTFKKQFF